MERRSFLQLLAIAALGPSLSAMALVPEHKNQTLLRMMDDCLACTEDNVLLHQKFDEILFFINENYSTPSITEEEIAQVRDILRIHRNELSIDVIKTISSTMLETVFPLAVVKYVLVNTPVSPRLTKNNGILRTKYGDLVMKS